MDDETENNRDEQSKDAAYINGLHILLCVGVCILLCSPIIIIPQHDAIQHSQYWHELLMTFSLTWPIHWTLLTILGNRMFLKIDSLKSPKVCLILALFPILGFIVIYCGLYLIWNFCLDYNFPLPLACFFSDLMIFVFLVNLWYQFPKNLKTDKEERKRLIFFVLFLLWINLVINNIYNPLMMMLKKIPSKAKPVMAIVLPMIRSLDAKVLQRLLNKCGSGENRVVESCTSIMSNVTFNLFVTISVSTNSTFETTFCILLVGVLFNLYECFGIIKLHRKIETDDSLRLQKHKAMETKIRALAISEILEILVPLSYTLTFMVAYHGPNATILTGIKNDYWNQTPADNIGKVLAAELILFSVDFAALVVVLVLLWYFCKIKMLKQFCWELKKYWFLIAAVAGALITNVSINLCV